MHQGLCDESENGKTGCRKRVAIGVRGEELRRQKEKGRGSVDDDDDDDLMAVGRNVHNTYILSIGVRDLTMDG